MGRNPYRPVVEKYLQDKEARGEPLPGIHGRVNYRGVSIEAHIPSKQLSPGSELRLLLDASVDRLGVSSEFPVKQYRRAELSAVYLNATTYGQLKEYGLDWLKKHNYKSIPSYVSHLNAYMRYYGHNDESSTTEGFGVNFECRLRAYLSEAVRGKPVGSVLRLWSRIHSTLNKSKSLPSGFAPALTELVIGSGRSLRDIARAAGIKNAPTLLNWMQGDNRPTDPEQIARLEDVFDVLPGTLSSSLAFQGVRLGADIPKEWWPKQWQSSTGWAKFQRDKVLALIPEHSFSESLEELKLVFDKVLQGVLKGEGEPVYRQRLVALTKKVYRLKFENWPDHLKSEFTALKEYKTAPSGLKNKKRVGEWNNETAKLVQVNLQGFFGFLCLPADHSDPELRGMGLLHEDLTLAWLAVQDAVEDYLEFCRLRAGAYNTGTETFFVMCTALLQAERGWLWLHSELLDRLPAPQRDIVAAGGGWENYCDKVLHEFKDSLESLKRNGRIRKTRDPMIPIWPILDHSEPLSLINGALDIHRRDLVARSRPNEILSTQVATQWRDHVLISFLARFPLRAKHWGLMTYNEDGSGYLQNHPRDGWRLVIPFDDFKNVRNTEIFTLHSQERVLVLKFSELELLEQLVPLLEFYLNEVRPIIAGDKNFLFPKRYGEPISGKSLNTQVRVWTGEYLSQYSSRRLGIKGVFPFGPHAFRDIVATHIIKTTGSISLAANILLDSEEMVRKHYARFLPEDRLKLAMAEMAAAFKKKGSK